MRIAVDRVGSVWMSMQTPGRGRADSEHRPEVRRRIRLRRPASEREGGFRTPAARKLSADGKAESLHPRVSHGQAWKPCVAGRRAQRFRVANHGGYVSASVSRRPGRGGPCTPGNHAPCRSGSGPGGQEHGEARDVPCMEQDRSSPACGTGRTPAIPRGGCRPRRRSPLTPPARAARRRRRKKPRGSRGWWARRPPRSSVPRCAAPGRSRRR